ncbi:MAG: GldG family protein [Pseudomonadota bacterium]
MTARQYLAAMGALLALLFVGATLLTQSWLAGARIDFTENRLYSVSDGTRQTLAALSEPIEINLVYTRDAAQAYPEVRAYATRVRELLETYESIADRGIRLSETDPEPFSEAEDMALRNGLLALDSESADPVYFGLIASNSVDQSRVIPFLSPDQETSLEYDITRLLQRLDRPEPPRIGLLSSLSGIDAVTPEAGYAFLQDLEASYQIERINAGFATLPPEIDVLVIVHPPELSDWQLFQIDQFLMNKGRALLLLDPAAKTAGGDGPFGMRNRQIRSDLGGLTEAWGVTLSLSAIADAQTALAIETEGQGGRTEIVRHPLFLSVPSNLMSQDAIVTADLRRSVNFAAPGRLELDANAPGERQVLIESGPAPARIPAERAAIDLSAEDTLDLYEAGPGPAILAIRVTGTLNTAFPDGAPTPETAEDTIEQELLRAAVEEQAEPLRTSRVPAEIIVVADADMVEDSLYLDTARNMSFADNSVFLLNGLDSLAGGSELMSLRARAPGRRPMVRVERLRDAAQTIVAQRQEVLQAELAASQAELETLQAELVGPEGESGDAELNAQQQAALERLRLNIVETRGALREIERSFRRDIDRLEGWLRLFTLAIGPIIMIGWALFIYWRRRRVR